MAGRLWLRLRPSNRLPPLADTKVEESWRGTEASDSEPWSTLVNPNRRSLSTRPTLAGSGRDLPGFGDGTKAGGSWEELGRSGCGARPKFKPYTSWRKSSAGLEARKLSAECWRDSMGTGEGAGEWVGELGGVLGRRRKRGCRAVGFGDEGGVSVETCAEMPLSRTSLARPPGGAAGRRGGKESPRLSRQGVTGVLGPVLMELGVLAMMDD